jgi:hypothetical protein
LADERLPWFPCEQSKLLAALSAMKPHVGYTYWIVCLRCYEEGGACPDTLDALARRTGYNKRVVSEALDVLFRAGKLVRDPAGIVNPYAAKVIAGIRLRREGLSQSGREAANRRWQKTEGNQSNGHAQPNATAMRGDAYLDLEVDKERGRKKEVEPRAKRRAPRSLIPEDWSPTNKDRDYAIRKGFDLPKIGQMAAKFVNHHRSRGTMIADLAATWRTWCDNEVEFSQRSGGGRHEQRSGNSAIGAVERLQRRLEAGDDHQADKGFALELPPGRLRGP